MRNSALILLIALSATLAHADLTVDSLAKLCQQETLTISTCKALRLGPVVNFKKEEAEKLQLSIEDSTGSWGDSIFEGEVDSLQEGLRYTTHSLFETANGQLLGYKVRFSYKAWETTCAKDGYDREKPATYRKCKKGRIYQTILVTPDLEFADILREANLILRKK